MARFVSELLLLMLAVTATAQSGLNQKEFHKYWRVESEAPDYQVSFSSDTCEIVAPKGLTLWRKQPFTANTTVEYDAMVMDDRVSDLNCFWLASDPQKKDIWARAEWRSGVFLRCYSLQMYYLGYGGNHNTTTRFRRYNGNERGIDDADQRPAILKEYTDAAHLLRPNHWYHIKIESFNGRTRFYVDNELIVDYLDPQPLQKGWFGFRTTLSRTRITNFHSQATSGYSLSTGVPLHWIGKVHDKRPVTFGIPFKQGELKDASVLALSDGTPSDAWATAYWPDGSVKWAGMSAVTGNQTLRVVQKKPRKGSASQHIVITDQPQQMVINTGRLSTYIPKSGQQLIDSMVLDGKQEIGRTHV